MNTLYERPFVAQLENRLAGEKPLIQVLVGPRQVGKTTGIRQLLERTPCTSHFANADDLLVAALRGALAAVQALRTAEHRSSPKGCTAASAG